MTPESAATVVVRMLELYSDGTPQAYGSDRYLDLVALDCAWREDSTDSRFDGRRGTKMDLAEGAAQSGRRLRNRHAAIDELLSEGERVVVFWTWSALSADTATRQEARVVSRFTVHAGAITRWHDLIVTTRAPR